MCGQYREVAALAHLREDAAQVGDVWRIDAGALARPEICGSRRLARVVVLAQQHFDLPIAFGNLALVVLPALQCLAQCEQVLGLPGPAQRLLDALRLVAPDPQIAQPQQPLGVALAVEQGAYHRQAAHAGERTDDVVELDVHALQRLLHVLHVRRSRADVVRAQPQVVLQAPDVRRRYEARAQQAVRMQRRPPLAVLHVGLASREVARLAAVYHQHLESRRFEHAVQRQPVHPGGLHRHRTHPLCQQPIAQRVQLSGHGAKHRGRPACNRCVHLLAADVYECGTRVKHRQVTHEPPPLEVALMAVSCREPGRVQGMTNLSNGKLRSPECASVRGRSQSNHRAVKRAKRLTATLLSSRPRALPYPGSRSVCSFGSETGS